MIGFEIQQMLAPFDFIEAEYSIVVDRYTLIVLVIQEQCLIGSFQGIGSLRDHLLTTHGEVLCKMQQNK